MGNDIADTVADWFAEHRREREQLARKSREAYDALQNKNTTYARGILACCEAHEQAAAVYVDALIGFRAGLATQAEFDRQCAMVAKGTIGDRMARGESIEVQTAEEADPGDEHYASNPRGD